MSPASQSLLKFAILQLTDFNGYALSLPEPLINVTISAPISEPPPTFVQWCLLTCDAFRDLSHLPFLHQSCWNMRRMCWTSCPAVLLPQLSIAKKPKNPFTSTLCGWISAALTQHRAQAEGRYFRKGTGRVCKVFQGKSPLQCDY